MDDAERHRLEFEIFVAALDVADPAQRESFVRRKCGEQRALAESVLSLLAGTVSDSLPNLAAGAPLTAGTTIGPYVIARFLGEGSFGEVYFAERRGEFRKWVAIKIVKSERATPAILARFSGEKQILAVMSHPNVVGIHDAGTSPDGRPYFVTEFILGAPITSFCDTYRLDIDARLGLFQQVCDGVLHAHQKGIIHRDLKPRNILVSGEGSAATPKIIDFGIAKALVSDITGNAELTITGGPIGTPSYMSPEQWRGDTEGIDTRSDIYSLGVLLHELLTGALPFEGRGPSLESLRHAVLETDAKAPSARVAKPLAGRIRGELDWIVLRCLAKDRADRYPTVADLAADVRAHQSHNPVAGLTAKAGGRLYRARKLAWRHRREAGAASLVIAAIAFAGMWYRGYLGGVQREADGFVQQARMLSYRYPDLAAEWLSRARKLAPRRSDIGVEQAFVDLRRQQTADASREVDAVLDRDPDYGPALAIKAGLLRGAGDGAQADALESKARATLRPSELHYLALGLSDGALAIDLLSKAIDVAPGNTQALWQRAERYIDAEQLDDAMTDARAVVHLTNGLGSAWNLLGASTLEAGTKPHDDQVIRASLGYFDKALGTGPSTPLDSTAAIVHENRALAYRRLRDLDAAFSAISRAIELRPTNQEVWETRAAILFERDGLDGAEKGYSDAIRQFPDSARLFRLRGENRFKHFQLEGAISDLTRAIELAPETERPALLQLRGYAYRNLGDLDKALLDSQEALKLRPNWARGEASMAWVVLLQGDVRRAHDRLSHALAIESNATRLAQHAFTSWLLGDDDTAVLDYERACEARSFENACFWAWEIEARRSRKRAAERLLDLALKRVETPTEKRRAFVAALVAYARATSDRRLAAEQRVMALPREELWWALEAEYIFGCVAAARGDAKAASAWFEKCAAHRIADALDRNLAIARLRHRRF